MDRVTVSFLQSDRAKPHLARLADGIPDDEVLATLEHLRKELSPAEAAAVVETVRLRVGAASKFERAPQMLFTREALEQASGEIPAWHRADRFRGASSIIDLGCGIGGDAIALGGIAPTVGIDRDPVRVAMTAHNAGVYDSAVSSVVGDLLTPPLVTADAVFTDPSRRADGRRRLRADRYLPPLDAVVAAGRRLASRLAIKVAPGIDHGRTPPELKRSSSRSKERSGSACCGWTTSPELSAAAPPCSRRDSRSPTSILRRESRWRASAPTSTSRMER